MPRRSTREKVRLEEAAAEAKYIGTGVSVSFHQELQNAAHAQGMSLGGFLREALIDSLFKAGHLPESERVND